ncbi:MAG: energy transducer TonB [Bacteroidales bacterium]|jgi:protein TonB|nr:energy transducer TonB [Bacteroidales bacterium]
MEIKKSPKANLENKKTLFREIGLIAALALVLLVFEWSTTDKEVSSLAANTTVITDEEQAPITQETPPPPPEQIREPVMTEELQIVENDVKVETDFISTDDSDQKIEIKPYVEAKPVEEEVEVEEEIPFAIVEDKPTFQGKDANEFTKWVYNNIEYPEIAKENGIQGRVTVQFTIDKDGSVKDVKVLRGVDSSLDKEAVRVIQKSPKWSPGKQRNKPVKVKYTFPIIFQLR